MLLSMLLPLAWEVIGFFIWIFLEVWGYEVKLKIPRLTEDVLDLSGYGDFNYLVLAENSGSWTFNWGYKFINFSFTASNLVSSLNALADAFILIKDSFRL